MSRPVSSSETLTLYPSGYTGNNSYMTISSADSAYKSSSGTSGYASLTLSSTYQGYVYFTFTVPTIPSGASITSVTCSVRLRSSSNNTVNSCSIQLYNNTTAQGSANSIGSLSNTSTVYNITSGGTSWTPSNISNIRLRVAGQRRSSGTSGVIRVYGADLNIVYEIPGTEYEVKISNDVPGVTTIPSTTQYVFQGESQEIIISGLYGLSGINVIDNYNNADHDISSSLVYITSAQISSDFIPSQLYGSNGTTSNTNNGLGDTSSDTYAQVRLQSGTYLAYSFDVSSIPSDATIVSVGCKVKGCVTRSSAAATVRLYNGTTAMGSTVSLATSSNATVTDLNCGTWTRAQLNNVNVRVDSTYTGNSTYYANFYGAELTVEYIASGQFYKYTISNINLDHEIIIENSGPVAVTGVTLNQNTATIDMGDTLQLTATISPSNATTKTVTWSSNNTNYATVSDGLVTGVAVGTATITVTTTDGNYTASCTVTVNPVVYVQYKLATSLEGGKSYLIVNTNSGSGYALSNEDGGSRTLKGITITVSNDKLSIKQRDVSKVEFTYTLETPGDNDTGFLMNNGLYLYTDSGSGLRMYNSTPASQKHWHYVNEQNILWQFKDSNGTNGYEDTSSEYKYYLNWDSSGNFTDEHLTSPSISESTLPAIYLFVPDDGPTMHIKANDSWVQILNVYQKINGVWTIIQGDDITTALQQNKIYIKQ